MRLEAGARLGVLDEAAQRRIRAAAGGAPAVHYARQVLRRRQRAADVEQRELHHNQVLQMLSDKAPMGQVLDALVRSGLLHDDAQVTCGLIRKRWATARPGGEPGATIIAKEDVK